MSHYTTLQTQLVYENLLVKALADLGFDHCEVHGEAQPLYGYLGDKRKQTAEVIIRRKYVGRASNDIGFKLNQDKRFDAIISGYDRAKYSKDWLQKLTQRYAYHAAVDTIQERGGEITAEETAKDGSIHLVLRWSA